MSKLRYLPSAVGVILALAGSPPEAAAEVAYHDSIVVVLDGSGSMSEPMGGKSGQTKMEAATAAIKDVLASLPLSQHVGVLAFHGGGAAGWLHPLGPRDNPEALTRTIDAISPSGTTPLGEYLKKGADALLADRAAQFGYGSHRLLIVTDGEASDLQRLELYLPEVLSRGITVDVIGVAMAQAHTLAKTAHSYRRADDPEALTRAVAEVFAEISATEGDTAPGEGSFELAAAFPAELSTEVIKALAGSGNGRIGESHLSKTTPKPTKRAPKAQPAPPIPAEAPGFFEHVRWWWFLALFLMLRFYFRNKKSSKGGRTR